MVPNATVLLLETDAKGALAAAAASFYILDGSKHNSKSAKIGAVNAL
jgi:hypothetical protein